jgi:hypothetical protein
MRTDWAIYWQKAGIADDGTTQFLPPVMIRCRWDYQQRDHEISETTENVNTSGTVFPDRILVVGSFLMHGDETVLAALTEEEKANPAILSGVSMIKTQKIIPEWRHRNTHWKPNDQSDHIFIEVTL